MPELEPLLDWENIQGNVLGGFNKDHQTLVGYSFHGNTANAKKFLSKIIGFITPLREVITHKRERTARLRKGDGSENELRATWIAAAFSFPGLKVLSADAESFNSDEFRNGLPASSIRLGDVNGSPQSWVIGSPNSIPDIFLIIGADRDSDRADAVHAISQIASDTQMRELYIETGHDLSFYSSPDQKYPTGHEHFGFKDGISQPGVRGKLADGTYLTTRGDNYDPGDGTVYAQPGQPLICAGEFILGYSTQIDYFPSQPGPPVNLYPTPGGVAPNWAQNGSFLVFRRLKQDVAAFRRFTDFIDSKIGGTAGKGAAVLVGRWPSGAPLMRSPDHDDPFEANAVRNNAFAYSADNSALSLPQDDGGTRCPVIAHIRKVNPRDNDTDQGAASATLTHRILRRGIPYGSPLKPGAQDDGADRGLLFLSYQASIARQFEFLAFQWMNNPQGPRNPSNHAEGLGFDFILGQNQSNRVRFGYLPQESGDCRVDTATFAPKDWVIATGGGYFFAPSISAMRDVLAK